jgi:hypothetical protein
MGRSALVVAALLAAVLLASALTLASTVDFREEDLVSENVLLLYERWHGRHADQHAVPLRRVPPQHVNSVREECSREKAREEHAEEKS